MSRDVVFQEDCFPFATKGPPLSVDDGALTTPILNPLDTDEEATENVHQETTLTEDITTLNEEENVGTTTSDDMPQTETMSNPVESLGRGHRSKNQSTRRRDYVIGTVLIKNPLSLDSDSPASQLPSGSPYPICNFVSCDRFSPNHRRLLLALTTNVEPRSYEEAMKHEHWVKARDSEYGSLEISGTWRLEDLPAGKKALGCKWVFTIKYRADGTIERFKARLVVLGNHQKEGIDYGETFAPIAKMTTVRLFLDFAAKNNHEVHQMDVHNAFFHRDLHEEVYMKLPQGFQPPGETRVCRLLKSLYGLKQAPRCWFAKLATSLLEYGFEKKCQRSFSVCL